MMNKINKRRRSNRFKNKNNKPYYNTRSYDKKKNNIPKDNKLKISKNIKNEVIDNGKLKKTNEIECEYIIHPGEYIYTYLPNINYILCKVCYKYQIENGLINENNYQIELLTSGGICDCNNLIKKGIIKNCKYNNSNKYINEDEIECMKKTFDDLLNVTLNIFNTRKSINKKDIKILLFDNNCEDDSIYQSIFKKFNNSYTHQNIDNIIKELHLNCQYYINIEDINKNIRKNMKKLFLGKFQFYILNKELYDSLYNLEKNILSICDFCKSYLAIDYIYDILILNMNFYIIVNNEYKNVERNIMNFIIYNILRFPPSLSKKLCKLLLLLTKKKEIKLLISEYLIEYYLIHIDFYLSGYSDINLLNDLSMTVFTDETVSEINKPLEKMLKYSIELQNILNNVSFKSNQIIIKRREAYSIVLNKYKRYIKIYLVK